LFVIPVLSVAIQTELAELAAAFIVWPDCLARLHYTSSATRGKQGEIDF